MEALSPCTQPFPAPFLPCLSCIPYSPAVPVPCPLPTLSPLLPCFGCSLSPTSSATLNLLYPLFPAPYLLHLPYSPASLFPFTCLPLPPFPTAPSSPIPLAPLLPCLSCLLPSLSPNSLIPYLASASPTLP